MKKFIITISREFGCNAREVARKAAAELGVEFYDKDLVDMAAERAGISRDSFLDSEEMLDKNADRQRHNYYKYVTGKNRGDRDNKHLMIDVSEYGTDLTAEMICFAARKMFED